MFAFSKILVYDFPKFIPLYAKKSNENILLRADTAQLGV